MAGTINLALTQQFDSQGDPLSGGLLQFFQAGTTNPENAFQDIALTIVHPNPIVLDASGRVPMFYLADGFIKIRLTDKNGVVIIAADQLLVIGPSSGGSGGAGVDVTTVLQTGDIKCRYGENTHTGFVRCNGNTIGQTGSSATEIGGVGPVAQALYEYLWTFPNIALDSAVRGASAVADFGALKRLILPDLRGRVIAGLDDMGAAAANRLTSTGLGVSALVLGNAGGIEALDQTKIAGHTHLLVSNLVGGGLIMGSELNPGTGLPQDHSHAWGNFTGIPGDGDFTVSTTTTLDHSHSFNAVLGQSGNTQQVGSGMSGAASPTGGTTGATNLNHNHTGAVGGNTSGRSDGHMHQISGSTQTNSLTVSAQQNAPPTMVMTFYIKL